MSFPFFIFLLLCAVLGIILLMARVIIDGYKEKDYLALVGGLLTEATFLFIFYYLAKWFIQLC